MMVEQLTVKDMLIRLVLLIGCNLPFVAPATNNQTYISQQAIWRRLMRGYAKSAPPLADRGTEVKIGVYVNSFYSISETDMDYSISFYLRQKWNDPRLRFSHIDKTIDSIKLHELAWEEIWVPDVFFRNEKKAAFHAVTTSNRLLRLSANGDVWYVIKVTSTLACPMMLQKYPLDTQYCPMVLESFGYTTDTMYLTWLDSAAEVDTANQIPQYTLEKILKKDCTQEYLGGNFPCLQLDFVISRDSGFFSLQVYIPSMLVVILSWVSFWINLEAVPARISVGLITVLTMTTQSTSANASLPKVSYVKAIDVWMSACLVFVFAALLEYAVVNVLSRSKSYKHERPSKQRTKVPMDEERGENCIEAAAAESNWRYVFGAIFGCYEMPGYMKGTAISIFRARRVDQVSRRLFPFAFFIFNVVYWTIYTQADREP